jgi:hypothetical protein
VPITPSACVGYAAMELYCTFWYFYIVNLLSLYGFWVILFLSEPPVVFGGCIMEECNGGR